MAKKKKEDHGMPEVLFASKSDFGIFGSPNIGDVVN